MTALLGRTLKAGVGTISERRRDSSTGALGRAEACESDVITCHIKFLYRACEAAFSIRAATSFGWET